MGRFSATVGVHSAVCAGHQLLKGSARSEGEWSLYSGVKELFDDNDDDNGDEDDDDKKEEEEKKATKSRYFFVQLFSP